MPDLTVDRSSILTWPGRALLLRRTRGAAFRTSADDGRAPGQTGAQVGFVGIVRNDHTRRWTA